jgi:hypothetical protein
MKWSEGLSGAASLAVLGLSLAPCAGAQQSGAAPGSPSATTTLDGKQLPAPPPKFGGVIKQSAKDSTPWWPPRIVPPKGAPNVLLIMTDDQGYGVSGTFGGVIPTPALDRIANTGLRFTQFHSTALCSPTRAVGAAVANANNSAAVANANAAAANANAAAANANAAAAVANQNYTMGEIVGAIPAGCAVPVVNGTTYYLCGNTWFSASYGANGVYYRVVPTP